jgi:glycolate oxidase iron-sulfur subunit
MQTFITDNLIRTSDGREADRILRSCVHCGFCTATCPTYRLLGDELDSPRGRIYLIKGLLEGKITTEKTRLHLDRCLTCRACETYCPSGVEYGHLLDIGRKHIEHKIKRDQLGKMQRFVLRQILPFRDRFTFLLKFGQCVRPLLPKKLQISIPPAEKKMLFKVAPHNRKMILFTGCVQPALSPQTNISATRILGKLGIEAMSVTGETCCGAIDFHMTEINSAKKYMKRNIDAWWPLVENGMEAIVTTASGCGVMLKEYAYILREDPEYSEKAATIHSLIKDISEVISQEDIDQLKKQITGITKKLVFQNPCTLQHGQKLPTRTEEIIQQLGFCLIPVSDNHLCCGSAGVYSILQKRISEQLRQQKIKNLLAGQPDIITTANIGCQMHLRQATEVPVKHWIVMVDEAMSVTGD